MHGWLVLALSLACVSLGTPSVQERDDPFAFFKPTVVTGPDDRQRLASGLTVARVVSGEHHAITVFSATRLDASGDRLVAWVRHVAALKQSQYVQAIGRFSDPPRLDDLAALTLDDSDIDDLRRCRPHRCGLKLATSELAQLQQALPAAGTSRTAALQDAFRQLVLRRVQAYLAGGHAALPDHDDRRRPVSLQASFASLLRQFVFLRQRVPELADYVDRGPQTPDRSVESFLYWSKERFGQKPVISVTEIGIRRGDGLAVPDVVAVGKQVFATHYSDGSLSVTAIVGDGAHRYLAYLNASDLDVLDGFWGGLVRLILERRLKAEAPAALETMRHRLESGEPPP